MSSNFEIQNTPLLPQLSRWLKWRRHLASGWYLANVRGVNDGPAVADYKEVRRIRAHFREYYDHSRTDRLSPDEIKMWSNVNASPEVREMVRKERMELFATTPINKTSHGIVVDLLDALLAHDTTIRSVLEVGVYFGNVLDHLAAKHPGVEFTGIDLLAVTREINADFQRPNLHVEIGYALDMLEADQISADVVFFNTTATRFRVNEMRRYFRAIARKGRYVVVSEPIVHLPGGHVVDPMRLSINKSIPTVLSSPEWPPQYVHNYRGLAEAEGFKTLHYRIYEPEFWKGIHRIDLIAAVQ